MQVRAVRSHGTSAGKSKTYFSAKYCGANGWACCCLRTGCTRTTFPICRWRCSTPEAGKSTGCQGPKGYSRRVPFPGPRHRKRKSKNKSKNNNKNLPDKEKLSGMCPAVHYSTLMSILSPGSGICRFCFSGSRSWPAASGCSLKSTRILRSVSSKARKEAACSSEKCW